MRRIVGDLLTDNYDTRQKNSPYTTVKTMKFWPASFCFPIKSLSSTPNVVESS